MKKATTYFHPLLFFLCTTLIACSISYSFNGSSINYNEVKTITIDKFPIRSAYVWAPMESMFYNTLSDAYGNKTKLQIVKRNGDLQVSGEITEYAQLNKSVSSDGYSSQTQLKVTVNVRFTNTKNHSQDFEKQFSATSEYDSSRQLTDVQEELVQQIAKKMKLWLAGGINAQNVAGIIKNVHPELIDISSGIESAPGVKDYDALLKLDQEISKAK